MGRPPAARHMQQQSDRQAGGQAAVSGRARARARQNCPFSWVTSTLTEHEIGACLLSLSTSPSGDNFYSTGSSVVSTDSQLCKMSNDNECKLSLVLSLRELALATDLSIMSSLWSCSLKSKILLFQAKSTFFWHTPNPDRSI